MDTTSMFSKIHEIKGLSRENCQNSYEWEGTGIRILFNNDPRHCF